MLALRLARVQRAMTDAFTRLRFILLLAVEGVIILDREMKRFTKTFLFSLSLSLFLSPLRTRANENSIEPPRFI